MPSGASQFSVSPDMKLIDLSAQCIPFPMMVRIVAQKHLKAVSVLMW
jgi:hypothetical protein